MKTAKVAIFHVLISTHLRSLNLTYIHRIVEWFGFEGTLKIISFQPSWTPSTPPTIPGWIHPCWDKPLGFIPAAPDGLWLKIPGEKRQEKKNPPHSEIKIFPLDMFPWLTMSRLDLLIWSFFPPTRPLIAFIYFYLKKLEINPSLFDFDWN